jgi:hypothetical protein
MAKILICYVYALIAFRESIPHFEGRRDILIDMKRGAIIQGKMLGRIILKRGR